MLQERVKTNSTLYLDTNVNYYPKPTGFYSKDSEEPKREKPKLLLDYDPRFMSTTNNIFVSGNMLYSPNKDLERERQIH